ncbi:MAG TPA: DNA translocase FtsK 4TM domain-containing protein [Gemmataceae bacterium]|jgi:S-DNA-T family DNA segregation ATPase FtsK/SpoIIIE|nr:DNA translocase FtsK 4TM domain-containing protein [Gemmataceae bacterium]
MSDRRAGSGLPVFALTVLLGGIGAIAILGAAPSTDRPSLPGLYPQPFADVGDDLRDALVDPLGAAAWVFALGWIAVGFTLLRRSRWFVSAFRVAGWIILTACGCLIADKIGLARLPGPIAGAGGSVGAFEALWLSAHFEQTGSILILVAACLCGIVLAADYIVMAVVRVIRSTGRIAERTVRALAQWRPTFKTHTRVGSADSIDVTPTNYPIPIDQRPLQGSASTDTVFISRTPTPEDAPNTKSAWLSYELPPLKLLDEPAAVEGEDESRLRDLAGQLEKTFADFGLKVKVVGIHTGPVVTQYEIALETGLRVNKVTALSDDLALNLRVPSVRIVAPIPGKNTVGIEVPNEHRAVVRLKELIAAANAKVIKAKLPLLLGKDSEGRPLVHDLADMPHLLIAGRTGTGKSVCLNSIILSLLLTRTPEEFRLLMIDPKQVELAEYGKLPHLMHPVVTDNSKAEAILAWGVDKMEERYDLMRRARVRNIAGFNELGRAEVLKRVKPQDAAEADLLPDKLPYIVIIVDEVGDLMMAMKKEVEGHIIRLAQKSRAAGIHLILTTQRPTVDVITGLIKSNLPARICFQVADRSNSRVVLDESGAEKLLGKGDMLFLQPNTSTIVRAQASYASDQEILRIVGHLEVDDPQFDNELLNLENRSEGSDAPQPGGAGGRKRDPLYDQAVEVVVREGRGSVSLLQRALGIGYGRSARLIDFMAEDGIVGTYNGAQAREVLISHEQWTQMRGGAETEEAPV